MKAYTVSDFFLYLLRSKEVSDADIVKHVAKYTDFVNCVFRPSLLLMFEETEKSAFFAPHYKFQTQYVKSSDNLPPDETNGIKDKFQFVDDEPNGFIYQITRGGLRNSYSSATLSFPRTLHDFITDCDRMGISLEYKSGVLPAEVSWLYLQMKF